MSHVNWGPTGSSQNATARTGVSCGSPPDEVSEPWNHPIRNVVLYFRAEEDAVQLWSVSAHGQQDDSRVLDFPGKPVSWTLRAGGIFTCYHTSHDDEHFRISFRTLTDTHEEVVLQTTSGPGLRFDISPDGRFMVFGRVTHSESDFIGLRSPQRTL